MPRWALGILAVAFLVSGASGLAYESLWSRYLGLFVGHAAHAQVLVLAVFLGGMAVGALLVGRARALRSPLLLYAAVELLIAALGALFHPAFVRATGAAHATIFPALGPGLPLALVKWTLAGALVLPQSVLLGMTFPLMAAGILGERADRPGHVLGLLYGLNSLGAAIGVLVAGFAAVPALGLAGTMLLGAGGSLLAAILAGAVAVALRAAAPAPAAPGPPAPERPLERLLLAAAFVTAVSSFFYEVAWTRMLALVLGSATHAFELMLSGFILGLALGSLWARRRLDAISAPLLALGLVQAAMGLAALATLPVYLASFGWTARLVGMLTATDDGYRAFSLARYGFCLAVMLPATLCAGMTLPLITRALVVAGRSQRAAGLVYGWNTLGSILGALAAGLALLPLLGLEGLVIAGAAVDLGLGAVLLRAQGRVRLARAAAAVLVLAVAATARAVRFDEDILTSGVFRTGRLPAAGAREFLYYRDGRTSTVATTRDKATGLLTLSTNGKPDASLEAFWLDPKQGAHAIAGDIATQILLPLFALAHAPGARRVAVIGQGSGLSSHTALASPTIERAVTIEIEPAMVEGSRPFAPANHRVFDDPRSRIAIDDARSYFAASGETFDLVLSEPSNAWVSGVGSLFTVEFYAGLRRHLAPDGVLAQWLHLYEIDDELVLGVLAAVHRSFPAYQLYLTSPHDLIVIAGARALPPADWSLLEWKALRGDLEPARPLRPWAMEAAWLGSRTSLGPMLGEWEPANSDFRPALELGAERTRFLRREAAGFLRLSRARFDLLAPFDGRRRGPGQEPQPALEGLPRVDALALGAALRGGPGGAEPEAVRTARSALWAFDRAVAAGAAPPDWRPWLQQFTLVEAMVHAGTAGWVDAAFYRSAADFLDRARAPRQVRDAVSFLHGLAAWDFAEAAAAAGALAPLAAGGDAPLPADLLLEGGVVARLCRGEPAEAQRLLEVLAKPSGLAREDLRVRLLASLLRASARGELPPCR